MLVVLGRQKISDLCAYIDTMDQKPCEKLQMVLILAMMAMSRNDGNTSVLKYVSLFNFGLLKQRLIEWIVIMHITFSQVENEWFRRFLEVLSPRLTNVDH
jgi:hypothetical protein